MPSLTTEEFLDYLKRSDLLDAGKLDSVLANIKQETPGAFHNSDLLATEFVKRNLLTSWHVRQLMKRKYKGFYLRQYRILGHLGSGGMSSVYLAEHTVMKRRVAIKVLLKRLLNPTYLDRFTREAQAIAALDSEYIVRAYDVDRFEDVHYIVMEYFEGQNLRQLVEKEGPLAYEDATNYIRQAALGLADAHRLGIVHRDVKPENILVNEHDFVKILDLGLALLNEQSFTIKDSIADEDKILGTADYLAPEQALNSHCVDARADIYGLGSTLYFCLTGKPPFPFGTISERLLAHQRMEPTSIFIERPDAPADLVAICSKMMDKKPEDRFQSAEKVADVMKRWLIHNGFAQPNDFAQDLNSKVRINAIDNIDSHSNFEHQLQTNSQATEMGFERETSGFMLSDVELASVVQQKNDNSVDLYDSAGSGGLISSSKLDKTFRQGKNIKSSLGDNLILSQKSDLDSSLDPLVLALNEIADTTKTALKPEEGLRFDNSATGDFSSGSAKFINISSYQDPSQRQEDAENPRTETSAPLQKSKTSPNGSTSRHCAERTEKYVASKERAGDSSRSQSSTATHTNQKRNVESEPSPLHIQEPLDWYKEVPIWFWTVAIGGVAAAFFLAGVLLTLLLSME